MIGGGSYCLQQIPVALQRHADELAASAHIGLGKQLLQRVFHCTFRNVHPGSDFLVRETLHQEAKHLHFPGVERDALMMVGDNRIGGAYS